MKNALEIEQNRTQCYFLILAKILTLYNANSMPVIFDFINDILIEILFQNQRGNFVKIGTFELHVYLI
jgi:hypothetical protein